MCLSSTSLFKLEKRPWTMVMYVDWSEFPSTVVGICLFSWPVAVRVGIYRVFKQKQSYIDKTTKILIVNIYLIVQSCSLLETLLLFLLLKPAWITADRLLLLWTTVWNWTYPILEIWKMLTPGGWTCSLINIWSVLAARFSAMWLGKQTSWPSSREKVTDGYNGAKYFIGLLWGCRL